MISDQEKVIRSGFRAEKRTGKFGSVKPEDKTGKTGPKARPEGLDRKDRTRKTRPEPDRKVRTGNGRIRRGSELYTDNRLKGEGR